MSTSVQETSLSADIFRYIRYQLRGRRGLIIAAIALAVPALWLGWPWLVMAGVAPLLIALAPCAIMCGLGLCAMKACSSSSSSEAGSCSKSQAGDQTVAPLAANRLMHEAPEPLGIAAPTHSNVDSVERLSAPRPEQAGYSPNSGEADCCSKPKAVADQLASETADAAAFSHVHVDSVEGQIVPQPDQAGPLPGEPTNLEKEKFQ